MVVDVDPACTVCDRLARVYLRCPSTSVEPSLPTSIAGREADVPTIGPHWFGAQFSAFYKRRVTSKPSLEVLAKQLTLPWNNHRDVRVKSLEDSSLSNVPHPVA